jgi:phosphoribosyl 1,2-cyclic phosphodiesterase
MIIEVIASSSAGNCYILRGARGVLLIEAGVPIRKILKGLNHNIGNLTAAIVSHEHLDHAMAIEEILRLNIDVYASYGTYKALGIDHRQARILEPNRPVSIGEFKVLPFNIEHDASEPLGYVIESMDLRQKLVFATDTYFIKYNFKGIDCYMIEANYDQKLLDENVLSGQIHPRLAMRTKKSHFEINDVEKFFKASDLSKTKKIILLHPSSANADPEDFEKRIYNMTGVKTVTAKFGLRIEF